MITSHNPESGYTLLETVVALSLFMGVLIPVIGMASNLLLDGRVEQKQTALRVALTGLAEAQLNQDGISVYTAENGLEVRREVTRNGSLVHVRVTVLDKRSRQKEILKLHRSLVDRTGRDPL